MADFTPHYGFTAPTHPQLAIIDLAQYPLAHFPAKPALRHPYLLVLKRRFYGQHAYDHQRGVLGFFAPGQPVQLCPAPAAAPAPQQGWLVVFHPDVLPQFRAGAFASPYPFFSYRVQQALPLTAKEDAQLHHAVTGLRRESEQPAAAFSAPLLRTQLKVLLHYASRFYHRQFPAPPAGGPDLLSRFEALLARYLETRAEQPLPTVQQFAEALHVSPAYLGEVMRVHTGQNAQQYLHQALLEKARGYC